MSSGVVALTSDNNLKILNQPEPSVKNGPQEKSQVQFITVPREKEAAPEFLPKPGDEPKPAPNLEPSPPVGPWATGRTSWGPVSGLTGVRPAVDCYSVTRFSDADWRQHNHKVLTNSASDLHRANMAEFNSRRMLKSVANNADKLQNDSTQRLSDRRHETYRWKTEVNRAIEANIEETKLLENRRKRLVKGQSVLALIHSITSECLARRCMREGHELARDSVEEELIKEIALIREVDNLMNRTLEKIYEQIERNNATKQKLELDWSDKKESFNYLTEGACLNNSSNNSLFKPASARSIESQSTPEGWEKAAREVLATGEAVREQSCELRALLEGPLLTDCVRDLKAQADRVDIAFAKRITETSQSVRAMEDELNIVVQRIVETEKLVSDLQLGLRALDRTLKVAQTRLDLTHKRPRVENCRDSVHTGLTDEVKTLNEQINECRAQLQEAENSLHGLLNDRALLEKELQDKLKTLYIDKERCQKVRAHYPSATAMAGY